MYQPYIGEIRLFAGSFAPRGWALCNGQLMPISQNTALFSLLGLSYGGNGTSTFGLPNLMGASPVGTGAGAGLREFVPGARAGTETVTLLGSEMPQHTHAVPAVDAGGTTDNPSGAAWAQSRRGRAAEKLYGPAAALVAMAPTAVGVQGSSQPHENMPPHLVLHFCIALWGEYPARRP